MEKTNKEETKPILCYGKDFSGHLQHYLKFVGVNVVPIPSQIYSEYLCAEFRDRFYKCKGDEANVSLVDKDVILHFGYQNIKISDDSIYVEPDFYSLNFPIKEQKNGGFTLVVERRGEYCDEQCVVVNVNVDLLNNIDISVGTSEDIVDYGIRIPAGKSEYGDANFYLEGIYNTLSRYGEKYLRGKLEFYMYNQDVLEYLRLAFDDPRLLSRLNELIKKIPNDINKAFNETKAKIEALAQEKIAAARSNCASDVKELTAIRNAALRLQNEALTSVDYLEDRTLEEYTAALESARTGDTK